MTPAISHAQVQLRTTTGRPQANPVQERVSERSASDVNIQGRRTAAAGARNMTSLVESGPFRSAGRLSATLVVLVIQRQNSRVNSAPHTVPAGKFLQRTIEGGNRT